MMVMVVMVVMVVGVCCMLHAVWPQRFGVWY
jgi:hypothetical protein